MQILRFDSKSLTKLLQQLFRNDSHNILQKQPKNLYRKINKMSFNRQPKRACFSATEDTGIDINKPATEGGCIRGLAEHVQGFYTSGSH